MLDNILNLNYPAEDITDGQYLYRSLGAFWTNIFQDKDALKGYTLGMAEEAVQAYINLLEIVNQYSIQDIEIFHTEKWLPIFIKKSEFNSAPFVFEPDGALFGYQPITDPFYAGQLFKFGFPKETSGAEVFSFTPKAVNLAEVNAIANRVIAPSVVLVDGVDYVLEKGTLFFKTNIFSNEYIPRVKIVGDLGKPATFKNSKGETVEDELVVLWAYTAKADNKDIYKSFGTLFDINLPSTESYKTLLKALMSLYVEGPTISALNAIFAALVTSPIVIEPVETIEDIYSDAEYQFVITDKHVYKLELQETLQYRLDKGVKLYAGETLSESIYIVDTVIDPLWWRTEIPSSKLGLASHVFAASTKNQLFFSTSVEPLTYTGATTKRITFPVTGRPEDVTSFQDNLNVPENKSVLLERFGWSETETYSTLINPVDFLFSHVIKNNTLLLKLNFYNLKQTELFFDLLPTVQPHLPSHVYLLSYLQFNLNEDVLYGLNNAITIPGIQNQTFSIDGSIPTSGARPGNPSEALYYKDYSNRLFSISIGPYKDNQPLHADGSQKYSLVTNIDELSVDNSTQPSVNAGIRAGTLRTEIPLQVKPAGEIHFRTPSTREIPTILLIDF